MKKVKKLKAHPTLNKMISITAITLKMINKYYILKWKIKIQKENQNLKVMSIKQSKNKVLISIMRATRLK